MPLLISREPGKLVTRQEWVRAVEREPLERVLCRVVPRFEGRTDRWFGVLKASSPSSAQSFTRA